MENGHIATYQGRLSATQAAHAQTALRLMDASARLERKSIRAAFSRPACRAFPARVDTLLHNSAALARATPDGVALTPAQEDDLESELFEKIDKVMGIMATMIREMEADMGAMEGMIDMIAAIDNDFFTIAGMKPEELKRLPPQELRRMVFRLVKSLIALA